MKRLILGVLILFSIISCNDLKSPEKPKNLISKNKMVDIIVDIGLLSATRGFDRKKLDSNGITLKSYIYDKYNIDSLQLAKSNEYYVYNIKDYEDLFKKVDDSLKVLEEQFQDKQDEESEIKLKKDSLSKLTNKKLKPLKEDETFNKTKPEKIKENI